MASKEIRIPKNWRTNLSGGIIQVIVGSDSPVTLYIHENVICGSSDFFKVIMSSDWKESRERSIELKDDNPDTFEIYQHWLYFGTVPTRDDESSKTDEAEYLQLAEAYVLGDKLGDGNFKDVIIDAMLHKSLPKVSDGTPDLTRVFPGEHVIRHIYDNTPNSSEARRLLVYFYANYGSSRWLNDAVQEEFPNEFLIDLAVALFERQDKRTPAASTAESNACKYHQHGSGPCYKDRFNFVATAKRLDSTPAPRK